MKRGKYGEAGMGAGFMREMEKRNFARRMRRGMTRAEVLLWAKLRGGAIGYRFRRQAPVGPFVVDFACVEARLVVEIDGATHATAEEVGRDDARTRYLDHEGWRVLRFWNWEVVENIDGVIEPIGRTAREHGEWLKRRESP